MIHKPLFLIGYMGVGKSTIGKALSKKLNIGLVDLDKYIENRYRKTIRELFDEKGEDAFRKIEQNALHEVARFENVIIATGGGTPCFFNNMEIMNRYGTTIYIKANVDELVARLLASKNIRPIIHGKLPKELITFVKKHLSERAHYYQKATITFETERLISKSDVYKTVDEIAQILKNKYHAT